MFLRSFSLVACSFFLSVIMLSLAFSYYILLSFCMFQRSFCSVACFFSRSVIMLR